MDSNLLARKTNFLVIFVVAVYLLSQLVLQFALGKLWIERYLYFILGFIQLFIILLPALAFVKWQRIEPSAVFRFRKISLPQAVLIVIMSVASGYIATFFNTMVVYLLGLEGSAAKDVLPPPGNIPELLVQIAVVALLPAFCEEFFFRGVMYYAFEGLGTVMATVVTAFYFALFHFDIRNFIGPLFLGTLIAWYCRRTGSLFAGMLAHFTNNLLAILAGWFSRDTLREPLVLTNVIMRQMFIFSCIVGTILIMLIKAFEAITGKKAKAKPMQAEKNLSLSVILHWPMWLFYGAYLIIAVIFLVTGRRY